MDNQNNLVTQDGNFVLDESQQQITIDANGGQIAIGKAGNITVGRGLQNIQAGQISLNEFENQKVLVKEGNGLYQLMDPEVEPIPATNITVHQGYLERSNVNSIEEMTNMITAIRAFEAYQKVIQTLDEADDQAVNSIGRVV
jgi:flagellar basal-body rod protein FlgF